MKRKRDTSSKASSARRAELTVETLPLAELKPHPENPRKHPDPGTPEWEALRKSLEHDYFDPIVWNRRNGMLVSGHLRVKVLTASGFDRADCVVVDYDDAMHKVRMIAANRLVGQDDAALLKDLLQELDSGAVDMDLTGYTAEAIEQLMTQVHQPEAVDLESPDAASKSVVKCPKCGFSFEVTA
jgi:ParB-like chromosome segregation protein Spo0J